MPEDPKVQGYFDYNATAPLHPAAREAWLEMTDRFWYNPSSLYREAAMARQKLEDCREKIAVWIGCGPEDILFVSGATEANNALISYAASRHWKIAYGATEHPCLLEPASHLMEEFRQSIPVDSDGVTRADTVEKILTHFRPDLVAVMAANNETGVLQPWEELREQCQAGGSFFHCDAAQWIGKYPSKGLGQCDFVTGSAHKFGGPKGIGFLKISRGAKMWRWLQGGPQESGRRAGTENLPAIAAMTAAWEAHEDASADHELLQRRLEMRTAFEQQLLQMVPGASVVAGNSDRLWNTVLLSLPAPTNLRWLTSLSAAGFAVSTGSACSRGAGASVVLEAMGVPEDCQGQVIRVSSGWETTREDWLSLASAFAAAHSNLQRGPALPRIRLGG